MTALDDTVAALLADPLEQLHHLRLLDRLTEETADPHAAALALVLQFPESDGPRLLYAAWCERNGQADRGELIRAQCALATYGRANQRGERVDGDQWNGTVARMRDLFFGGARGWFRLPGLGEPSYSADRVLQYYGEGDSRDAWLPCVTALTDRGFLDEVRCSAALIAHFDAIRARHPVTRVRLTAWPLWNAIAATCDFQCDGFTIPQMLARRWPGVEFELPSGMSVPFVFTPAGLFGAAAP